MSKLSQRKNRLISQNQGIHQPLRRLFRNNEKTPLKPSKMPSTIRVGHSWSLINALSVWILWWMLRVRFAVCTLIPLVFISVVDDLFRRTGHLFCHKCIIDTLKFSEDQKSDHTGKTARGTCPVCRKPLARSDGPGPKRNLIPLKLKLATKKRSAVVGSSA